MSAIRPTVIGLTGGISSGKSTAARHLAGLGAQVVDCDQLGHQAYAPDTPCFEAVKSAFGDDVVSDLGTIDRQTLGAKVFGKPDALQKLTDIVWPEIGRLARAEIASVPPGDIAVMEAAVLFEANWSGELDEIWVVLTDPDVAVERTMARDGLDAGAVRKRLASQLSNEERAARADVVIDNSTGLEHLYARLDAEWQRLLEARRAE